MPTIKVPHLWSVARIFWSSSMTDRDLLSQTIYGFPVEDLIIIAALLREEEITKDELTNFTLAFECGYRRAQSDFNKAIEEQLANILKS